MRDIMRLAALVLVSASLTLVPAAHAEPPAGLGVRAAEVTGPVVGSVVRRLPFAATNVALYWMGNPDARVTVAFSLDRVRFGSGRDAGRDEIGSERANGTTYGAVLAALGATAVRVKSDRPIGRLTVLALADRATELVSGVVPGKPSRAGVSRPPITSRAEWGANESLRFANDGSEKWRPTFAPVQKLIVHHTDTRNDDPNPAATIRAIYHYHAVTQGWGDIGYNFLIDGSGRIYKGRNSHPPGGSGDSISGEDNAGHGVTAAHARSFNRGTVGVALLGNLTSKDATPAATDALEHLLAWKADKHGIDPHGAASYTNSSGSQTAFPNIAGHRDVGTTACPGGTFYQQLPAVRNHVAARVGPP